MSSAATRPLTDSQVNPVDSDSCIPAFPDACPVCVHRVALGEENDNGTKVGDEQSRHDTPRGVSQPPRVFDSQQQEHDRYFEETYTRKEKHLGNPSKHVVVDIILLGDVPSMPAIAELNLRNLDRKSRDTEPSDHNHDVVVPSQGAHREAHPHAQTRGDDDECDQRGRHSQQDGTNIAVRGQRIWRRYGGHGGL